MLQIDGDINKLHLGAEGIILGLLALVTWLLRGKIKKYDDHLDKCADKEAAEAVLSNQVESLDERVVKLQDSNEWVGDCIVSIGARMKVELPDRPSNRTRRQRPWE